MEISFCLQSKTECACINWAQSWSFNFARSFGNWVYERAVLFRFMLDGWEILFVYRLVWCFDRRTPVWRAQFYLQWWLLRRETLPLWWRTRLQRQLRRGSRHVRQCHHNNIGSSPRLQLLEEFVFAWRVHALHVLSHNISKKMEGRGRGRVGTLLSSKVKAVLTCPVELENGWQRLAK